MHDLFVKLGLQIFFENFCIYAKESLGQIDESVLKQVLKIMLLLMH
jgi:hypothetical protein